ncbi:MAG TPA: beta-propeller domain-containing protein [Jatrophihabitantaceae bacterium]|jgi:uncharacterized secreted protein with C-terminal beta-propeller domain
MRGVAVGAGVAGLVWVATSVGSDSAPGSQATTPPVSGMKLVAYGGCADMVADLRAHAARNVGIGGVTPPGVTYASAGGVTAQSAATPSASPAYSPTNDYVPGADEPDLVKTDGDRLITVERGVLRVVDARTEQVTTRLLLSAAPQTWGASNLLVEGDRALVIVSASGMLTPGGGGAALSGLGAPTPGGYPGPIDNGTRYVLVDLSGQPRVLGTFTPSGSYVDARLVGSTVRLVVRSQPEIVVPQSSGQVDAKTQLARARAAVQRAPATAWLPEYQVRDADGHTSSRTAACRDVSHPADYTGTSMLTVYSIDLNAGLADVSPVSLAADGDTVYATTTSLYIASNPQWWLQPVLERGADGRPIMPKLPPQHTEIHRFDISAPGPARYVASGVVPGRLLNQYSLSEYDGYLRVATTSGYALADEPGQSSAESTSSSSVFVLRADRLTKVSEVDGLGGGQRIYSVRFIGPVGYVVTFQQMDPLYTLDLRDPTAPRVAGAVELTGYSSYLYPVSETTLIGVGEDATTQGRPIGLQMSLFDVGNPSHPLRIAHLVKTNLQSGAEWDPHAFLYWPQTGAAVLPVSTWQSGQFRASALVLRVGGSQIAIRGSVTQPSTSRYGQAGIMRSVVIGDDLWTVSDDGLMVSDLSTLGRRAWILYH